MKQGAQPAGLGARDSLRVEMGFCLYGHEINDEISPLEARYWVFDWNMQGYVGADALKLKYIEGVKKIRLGFRMIGKSPIPRANSIVYVDNKKIGYVTSGSYSPILNKSIVLVSCTLAMQF